MFGLFKKKFADNEAAAVADGTLITLAEVNDGVFSAGMLGDGAAIRPSRGCVCSPVDGTLSMLFPTLHAFSVRTASGVDVLVHIGLNTVELKGEGFWVCGVKAGDAVRRGTPIVRFDLELVKSKGYDPTVMVVVTAEDDSIVPALEKEPSGSVRAGRSVMLRLGGLPASVTEQ